MFFPGSEVGGRLLAAGMASLLLITMAACGTSASVQPQDSSATGKTENTSSTVSSEKIYQMGESAQLFDIKLTIDDVQKTNDFDSEVLRDGMGFVLVKVTLENVGSEGKPYNYASFKLLSSDSKPDLNVTTLNNQSELHEGELAPGEKTSGIIPFEHPKNDPTMMLQFTPNIMSEQKIAFQLK